MVSVERRKVDRTAERMDAFWRSLRLFSIYRLVISALILASIHWPLMSDGVGSIARSGGLLVVLVWFYLLSCAAGILLAHRRRQHFDRLVGAMVLTDIVVFILIMHLLGGVRSGMGVLILVSLAGGAIVGQGRLAPFYAAVATVGMLAEQTLQALGSEFEGASFVQTGAISMAFFAVALLARYLASRIVAADDLAMRRGADLHRQLRLTTGAIAMLDVGILIVSGTGFILQANPRATTMLGLGDLPRPLSEVHAELAVRYLGRGDTGASREFWFQSEERQLDLVARFVDVADAAGDAILILQEVGQQTELARKQKLEALGRLTAGIAHEIRNPLSAIRYAAELMLEESRYPADQRMLGIVLDNTQRLDRIVRDVLELGRRDRTNPVEIDVLEFVEASVADFVAQSHVDRTRFRVDIPPAVLIRIDASHLRQILWNLLANAVRYASPSREGITIEVGSAPFFLAVADDGTGVPPEILPVLFEPFSTSESSGNGLGLYIARQLAEANGFSLDHAPTPNGARFVLSGEQ